MKNLKTQLYLMVCLIASFSLQACNDYLDVESKEQISDNILWSNKGNADLFLNNVYSSLPGPFGTFDPEENWTDNSLCPVLGQYSNAVYSISAYTPSDSRTRWDNYSAIRKANLFIEKVENSTLPDDYKKLRIAEARFLRAYYYMLLWTSHGGVPLVTKVLNQSEQGEAIYQKRNTADETFKFIQSECESILNDLPVKAEAGRVSSGAALALKAWVELFWASPLHNNTNDKAKWTNAASSYKSIINSGVYSLFPDYNTQFFEENNFNSETIFAKTYLQGTSLGGSREGLQGPWMVFNEQKSYAGVNPTQELVDDYVMANGLPISDPSSGYNPTNPYVNREKRFYQTIIFDGAEWLGDNIVMKQGVGSKNATDLGNGGGTKTGYYLRKGLNPKYTVSGPNQLNSANFIIFRYAEVLLGYAEAQNEAVGPDNSVYEAVNLVRKRSDLGSLPIGLSQDAMRIAIQRERRIELAFEEKRWSDLIRLKLAEKKLNGVSHGIFIEKKNGNWEYKVISAVAGTRVFYANKNYFLPIPQQAIDRNKNIEQNPNY